MSMMKCAVFLVMLLLLLLPQILKQLFAKSNFFIQPRSEFVCRLFLRNVSDSVGNVKLDEHSTPAATSGSTDANKKLKITARKAGYESPSREMLYGIHPVEMALAEKRRTFYKLFLKKRNPNLHEPNDNLDKIQSWAENLRIPIKFSHHKELSYFTNDAIHQGVVLQSSRLKFSDWSTQIQIFGKTDNEGKLFVYLDGIQDPMNMGALIRSCVFLGVDTIFLPEKFSSKLSTTVSKASSGALECASICTVSDPLQLMTLVQKLNWDILGTDSDCLPFDKYEITTRNRLLILGNEGHGVNDDFVNYFTATVSVPGVPNRVGSLNVSVSAGILLSHFTKLKRSSS